MVVDSTVSGVMTVDGESNLMVVDSTASKWMYAYGESSLTVDGDKTSLSRSLAMR